jgi:CheY-like chemotaxis protein
MTPSRAHRQPTPGPRTNPRDPAHVPVLIVEDERVAALLLAILHDGNGVSYDMASSAAQATDFIRAKTYELVLLNARLPDGHGIDIAQAIRARDGTARHTAIVVVTADSSPENREQFESAGVDDLVVKPVNPEKLQRLWDKWLHAARKSAAAPES